VFHGIKKICEIAGSVGGTHFGHIIRLSDLWPISEHFHFQPATPKGRTRDAPGRSMPGPSRNPLILICQDWTNDDDGEWRSPNDDLLLPGRA
jgi:hypothetical protein